MLRPTLPAFLLSFVCLFLAIGASARQNRPAVTSANFSLPQSEELVYQAELSRALIRGLDVAEFHLTANRSEETDRTGQRNIGARLNLHVEAESKGLLRKLFGVRFRQQIESTVEPGSFLVLRTKK